MSSMPRKTWGEMSWRTRRTVAPSAASSTSSTAAFDAVRRAFDAMP
jgi:hypothetical protein